LAADGTINLNGLAKAGETAEGETVSFHPL
jgi:hypothetical protein